MTIWNKIINSYNEEGLSSSDRKEIKRDLQSSNISSHKLNVYRSQLFDFCKTKIAKSPISVLNWMEDVNKLLLPNIQEEEDDTRSYFSPGNECKDAIIHNLRSAKNSVKICVFTISDNDIADVIMEVHRNKKHVKIISDDQKSEDKGSDIDEFIEKGLNVRLDRSPHHMHHKFCIIDNETLITGSYNWTRSAATSNKENILITTNEDAVKEFIDEFDELWDDYK